MAERSSRPSRTPCNVPPVSEGEVLPPTNGYHPADIDFETPGDEYTGTITIQDRGSRQIRGTVLEALTDANLPVTIDEVVDLVVARSDVEGGLVVWSVLHEQLYSVELPTLDATGALEFDPERGIVDVPANRTV